MTHISKRRCRSGIKTNTPSDKSPRAYYEEKIKAALLSGPVKTYTQEEIKEYLAMVIK